MEAESVLEVEHSDSSDHNAHSSSPTHTPFDNPEVSTGSTQVQTELATEFGEISIKDGLFAIADSRKELVVLDKLINDICMTRQHFLGTQQLLIDFESVANDLNNERRAHSEELRYINQDINVLEDVLKAVNMEQAKKKDEIVKKVVGYQNLLDDIVSTIQAVKWSGADIIKEEVYDCLRIDNCPEFAMFCNVTNEVDKMSANNAVVLPPINRKTLSNNVSTQLSPIKSHFPSTAVQNQPQNSALMQMLVNMFAQQQQAQRQQVQVTPKSTKEITNRKESKNPKVTSEEQRHKSPLPLSKYKVRSSQKSHYKVCQSCEKTIHRNAPTCQYCKEKIISKAAKKIGKKLVS